MLTIAGGKLTTFRPMAREVVDRVVKELGAAGTPGRELSESVALPGGEAPISEEFRATGLELGLSEASVEYLLRQYGTETPALYALCRQRPELREPLHPEHPAIAAEVIFGVQREFVCTPEDVLERRTRLALETRDHGAAAQAVTARLLQEYRAADPAAGPRGLS